jgi:hypothetical protein
MVLMTSAQYIESSGTKFCSEGERDGAFGVLLGSSDMVGSSLVAELSEG